MIKEALHYLQAEDSHSDKRKRKKKVKCAAVENLTQPQMTGQLYSKEPFSPLIIETVINV